MPSVAAAVNVPPEINIPAPVESLLQTVGGLEPLRELTLDILRWLEKQQTNSYGWRESVRWPIVRALLGDRIERVTLSDGLVFDLQMVSNLERNVLLAPVKHPDELWEPQTTKLGVRIASRGHYVLLAGAYIGDQALPIARALEPRGGRVFGFEPMDGPFEQLLHNCQLNRITNVQAERLGLWNVSGVTLGLVGSEALAHVEELGEDAPTVDSTLRTTTIDDYVRSQDVERLDLIMLDLEGAEFRALQGAQAQLELPPGSAADVIFEINSGYTDWSQGLAQTDIIQLLHGFGFTVYTLRDYNACVPMRGFPIELVDLDSTILAGPPHGFNLFATKAPNRLEELGLILCHDVSPKLLLHRPEQIHQPLHRPQGS
jgi:FkbM family methyltransferase